MRAHGPRMRLGLTSGRVKKKRRQPSTTSNPRRRTRWDARTIGFGILALTALAMVSVLTGSTVFRVARWISTDLALSSTVDETAAAARAALGDDPTVASILSSHAILQTKAHENGERYSGVFAAIERRRADDRTIHVVALELCLDGRHADIESVSPRLFSADELATLAREGITEQSTAHWKHHGHRVQRR